jgi:putative ABC transport system ATP-binding protein
VQLESVTKVYQGGMTGALSDVTLTINEGEFAVIMGSSGSGKSTLLNLVAGLDRPTSGRVTVCGIDVDKLGETALARFRRDRIGLVFQFFYLLPNLTALENVLLPAQLKGNSADARARELFEQLEIRETADRHPARLSGGQQQRVAIARALINEPALLLADEPTGALDTKSGELVMELLVQLNRDGQTILFVTHDARLATRYATRRLSMADGKIADDIDMRPAWRSEVS